MAKHKRGKKQKKNKKNNSTVEKVRTCVSGDKLDKSCISPLHLADLLSPLDTPSPKDQDRRDSRLLNGVKSNSFRPRSRSSVAKLGSPLEKLSIAIEKTEFDTPRSSYQRIKFNLDESNATPITDYKTPLKRMRSESFVSTFSKSNVAPPKYLRISPELEKNTSENFFTPNLPRASPNGKKSVLIHYSTPKNILYQKQKTEINPNPNVSRQSLGSIQSLSPIPKNEPELKTPKTCIPTPRISILTPTKRAFGAFRKYRRFGMRWPIPFVDLCSWFSIALKKAILGMKRYCYDTVVSVTAVPKLSESCCKSCDCHIKIQALTDKLESLTTEFVKLRRELEDIRKVRALPQPCGAPAPPPLPPPPPPPPPPMPIEPTPTSRPKVSLRKLEKQPSNENSRPAITVDDIKNVRLRKTSAATVTFTKKPLPPAAEESLFRQIKLRPPIRSNTPSTSASPKSSLTRILKNVDTNVRVMRRYKQLPSLSYDEFSRQRYCRASRATPNESAPVV